MSIVRTIVHTAVTIVTAKVASDGFEKVKDKYRKYKSGPEADPAADAKAKVNEETHEE
jgi:hypothetical protein